MTSQSQREIPPTVPFRPGIQRDSDVGLERIKLSGPTALEQRVETLEKTVDYLLAELRRIKSLQK